MCEISNLAHVAIRIRIHPRHGCRDTPIRKSSPKTSTLYNLDPCRSDFLSSRNLRVWFVSSVAGTTASHLLFVSAAASGMVIVSGRSYGSPFLRAYICSTLSLISTRRACGSTTSNMLARAVVESVSISARFRSNVASTSRDLVQNRHRRHH